MRHFRPRARYVQQIQGCRSQSRRYSRNHTFSEANMINGVIKRRATGPAFADDRLRQACEERSTMI
jgi:hypothetical protein